MAEGKNLYETVIVTSAKLGEEGSAELVNKFKALIAEHGTVESVDDWGKRRFAYPIAKQTEGYYTLINFESNPEFTAELTAGTRSPMASCVPSSSSGIPVTWLLSRPRKPRRLKRKTSMWKQLPRKLWKLPPRNPQSDFEKVSAQTC